VSLELPSWEGVLIGPWAMPMSLPATLVDSLWADVEHRGNLLGAEHPALSTQQSLLRLDATQLVRVDQL